MTGPFYIKLTITKATQAANGDRTKITTIKPPIERLYPLPMLLAKQQVGEPFLELDFPGITLTCEEHFEDALSAIEIAAERGAIIARPAKRSQIAAVTAFPMPTTAGEMLDQVARDAAKTGIGVARVTWDDVVQTAGENTGAPAEPKAGDLRVFEYEGLHEGLKRKSSFCVQCRVVDGPMWEWAREGVPTELRGAFETREAAVTAVKVAGYGRRLMENE
jgi:hypothetical protein